MSPMSSKGVPMSLESAKSSSNTSLREVYNSYTNGATSELDNPGPVTKYLTPDYHATSRQHRPSKSWSIWSTHSTGSQGDDYPRSVGSVPPLVSPETEQEGQDKDETTIGESIDKPVAESKRAWLFWNNSKSTTDREPPKEETKQVFNQSKSVKPLTNTFIPHSTPDAILFKTKTVIDMDGNGSKEAVKTLQNPNIVVPSFDILPYNSAWASISSSFTKVATRLNLKSPRKQPCLFQQNPNKLLNELSDHNRKPIKVLLIGVHGFFPTKMIRPFIGEPTGTSTKFITEAEEILRLYFQKKDKEVEINKIALEKEGRVFERVEFFYDILKRWEEELENADVIYFVAHSQGCPVTIILLGKLIESGVISPEKISYTAEEGIVSQRKVISVLAMAGINHGPFYGADQTLFVRAYQTIESDSLRELFEFQRYDSIQSKSFIQSLRIIIASNTKVTFVGSINDQLVPLYSSLCLFAQHPNIFRATFIDKDSRTPKFITRIVNIAGKLLNLGFDDHGIIKEMSGSLAGTLTGGGHSSVYNEGHVYELGLRFALETTNLSEDIPVRYTRCKPSQLDTNPYNLPWCMRGLIYATNKNLNPEQIQLLVKEFEAWEPETKPLKDIKYRLSGLKSKL